jgi:hypothetical protein
VGRRFLASASIVGALSLLLAVGWADAAPAQTPAPSPTGLDPAFVRADLSDWGFWLTLIVAVLFGAAGGVVYELLILQGNVELPHRPTEDEFAESPTHAVAKHLLDLGIWARVIIGALAALAALLVVSPSSTLRLVATSIVAGSAGTAVFRSVQDRLLAALAQREAAETREKAKKQAAKVVEAKRATSALKQKITAAAGSVAGESFGAGPGGPGLGPDEVTEVERLLSEAEGISETI